MSIPRIVYFAQSGTITPLGSNLSYVVPITSSNIDVGRPIEALSSFGKFGSLNTAQTNLTTCKSTMKMYMGSGSGFGNATTGSVGADAIFLNDLIASTKTSTGIAITVSPGGFTMTGILTNLGVDISMGGFGMCDLSFAGIGAPTVVPPNTTYSTDPASTLSLAPITTMSIGRSGPLSGVYATSIKFAYDLPTDTLAALGDNPNAPQGNSQLVSQIATKPPYKTTVSIEGHGVDPTILDTGIAGLVYSIGNLGIALPNAKVSARGFNNAAGQVSATFSYTAEDTTATITSVSLSSYSANATGQTIPGYGA